jgi:hypothetical protein
VASTSTAQEWTIVGSKKASQDPKPKPKLKQNTSNRLILLQATSSSNTSFSPLALRNAFNKAFLAKGIKGPIVATISRTLGKNIVVTTTPEFSADFLLEKQAIWEHIVPFKLAQKDEPWHKVILHGIPILDFNTPEGMDLVVDEIQTFNKGFTPIGTPYWLTSLDKRQNQRAGAVVVAFATEEEATRAIRNRLYIAGISVRVEKLYSTAPTTQCQNCQGFGHLDSYCKRTPICKLCAGNHATKQHFCNTCQAKGTSCPHLEPKCSNCQQAHTANTRSCEVLLAIRNKTFTTLP